MLRKLLFSFCLTLAAVNLRAQGNVASELSMADAFYADGKIYVVVAVVALILAGIIIYLVNLDRKVARLEKDTAFAKGDL